MSSNFAVGDEDTARIQLAVIAIDVLDRHLANPGDDAFDL